MFLTIKGQTVEVCFLGHLPCGHQYIKPHKFTGGTPESHGFDLFRKITDNGETELVIPVANGKFGKNFSPDPDFLSN